VTFQPSYTWAAFTFRFSGLPTSRVSPNTLRTQPTWQTATGIIAAMPVPPQRIP
jgi:hypothetical protein